MDKPVPVIVLTKADCDAFEAMIFEFPFKYAAPILRFMQARSVKPPTVTHEPIKPAPHVGPTSLIGVPETPLPPPIPGLPPDDGAPVDLTPGYLRS